MDIPKELIEKLQVLNEEQFDKIKDKEFRPAYDLMGLKYLRDKAGNERNLREAYRGRAPYELLQNADDAHAKHVIYILSKEGMAFAHDGAWFTTDNFRSLADGWSDKDPNQCIGHKGLGFRSVLDITPSPYLVRVGQDNFFGIKFTWALNKGHFDLVLQKDPHARKEYERWTKHGQIVVPVMGIPGIVKKQNLGQGANIYDQLQRGHFGHGYTTMFWLPAKDSEIDLKSLAALSPMPVIAGSPEQNNLRKFISSEVTTLIPFLKHVESVSLYDDKGKVISTSKVYSNSKTGRISVACSEHGEALEYFQMSFRSAIPTHITIDKETPKAVKEMKEIGITISVFLKDNEPQPVNDAHFHVYFPTREATGTGFIIHGDFFVKPDRTALMPGKYNEWLLEFAAQKTSNEYLTALLQQFSPKYIYRALAPTKDSAGTAAIFKHKYSAALQKRQSPFLAHSKGMATSEEIAIPPDIDPTGFWEHFFSDILKPVTNKSYFISHEVDNADSRRFFESAGLKTLIADNVLDLVEAVPDKVKTASWWYSLFSFMANEPRISTLGADKFKGRKMVLSGNDGIAGISQNGHTVICFPPPSSHENIVVPSCFADALIFVNQKLATLLKEGEEKTRKWIVDRLSISNFEANELIPQAIRSIVNKLFGQPALITPVQLANAWTFIKAITEVSRTEITFEKYWYEIGRFPLPLRFSNPEAPIDPSNMAPAFLSYFPDTGSYGESCLNGVSDLRRLDSNFIDILVSNSNSTMAGWIAFLLKAGVSGSPKKLNYARYPGVKELPLTLEGVSSSATAFTGDRQSDENQACIQELLKSNIWAHYLSIQTPCEHSFPKVLHSITLYESLATCCDLAASEYENKEDKWHNRLWLLIRSLDLDLSLSTDKAYCRGGKGGHISELSSYTAQQLQAAQWLPTSRGPASAMECFASQTQHSRLISQGKSQENLGDLLLPYVAAPTFEDAIILRKLGVEFLDDVDSADERTLVRALKMLGASLSSKWGCDYILAERSRWRLVRGAIQEIYRRLNQFEGTAKYSDILFPIKSKSGIEFSDESLYYAKPGSAIEKAFIGKLPLFDVDRPLKILFDKLAVVHLSADDTVKEEFISKDSCTPSPSIKAVLLNDLAPYLLAAVVDKGEKVTDRIVRRLKERFDVMTAESLDVSVSLISDPAVSDQIQFKKFYLKRQAVALSGASEEYHYTLFIEGHNGITFHDLDADALGEVLANVFVDRVTEEILGYFPRITSKFQIAYRSNQVGSMVDYLHHQLGISIEAQDSAKGMINGEYEPPKVELAPPPKAIHVTAKPDESGLSGDLSTTLNKHQVEIASKTNGVLSGLMSTSGGGHSTTAGKDNHGVGGNGAIAASKVSLEQKQRGLQGEEEIKRRISSQVGWEGFILKKDTRYDACGFDFLCVKDQEEVKVEVKTFTRNGYISMTNNELIEAVKSGDSYYLLGIMYTEQPENSWPTFIMKAPANRLFSLGTFEIDTRLQVPAEKFFPIHL